MSILLLLLWCANTSADDIGSIDYTTTTTYITTTVPFLQISTPTVTITSMTSKFTPNPDCSSLWVYEDESYNAIQGGMLRPDPVPLPPGILSSCYPPGLSSIGLDQEYPQYVYYPGVCPVGYTIQTSVVNSDTTTARCCYSDYTYKNMTILVTYDEQVSTWPHHGCVSIWSGTTTVSRHVDDVGSSFWLLQRTTLSGEVAKWAIPLTVQWQESDLSIFETVSQTASIAYSVPTTLATETMTLTAGNISAPEATTSHESPLSAASIAGISVGTFFGLSFGIAISTLLSISIKRKMQALLFDQPIKSLEEAAGSVMNSSTNPTFGPATLEVEVDLTQPEEDPSSKSQTREAKPAVYEPKPKFHSHKSQASLPTHDNDVTPARYEAETEHFRYEAGSEAARHGPDRDWPMFELDSTSPSS